MSTVPRIFGDCHFFRGEYSGNSAYNHRGTVSDFGEAGEEFLGFIGKN